MQYSEVYEDNEDARTLVCFCNLKESCLLLCLSVYPLVIFGLNRHAVKCSEIRYTRETFECETLVQIRVQCHTMLFAVVVTCK